MSENSTVHSIVDEDGELFFDEEYYDIAAHYKILNYIELCYLPFLIVIGVSSSLLVLTILIRRRLWIRHEAYIYLGAILIINIYELIFYYGDFWLNFFDHKVTRLSITADIVCKFWIWLARMGEFIGWLVDLLLLNVYLRLQQPITLRDGRGFCVNLSARYCSLFGTKVIVSSYFIISALSTFWAFSITGLENHGSWYCYTVDPYYEQHFPLLDTTWWFTLDVPLLIEAVLLLLIVWKRKRSSGIAFDLRNGASVDNGDAEAIARLFVSCAAVAFITGVPGVLNHVLRKSNLSHLISRSSMQKLSDALFLIYIASPLSVPIVCMAMKSRFRDDLKIIAERCRCRCCPGSTLLTTLSSGSDNNGSSVLQMDSIHDDTFVA